MGRHLIAALMLAWPGPAAVFCAERDAQPPVDTSIVCTSIAGEEIRPLDCSEPSCRAVVVIFVTTDCPITNRSAPEMEKIRTDCEPKGVKLTLVHVDPDLSSKEAARHAAEYALHAPVVIDRKHRLVVATGAKVTPEAVVIDRSGQIRYRGRINDQFADYGARRKDAKTHELREAISAVIEGRTVKVPKTKAIGCFIPELSREGGSP